MLSCKRICISCGDIKLCTPSYLTQRLAKYCKKCKPPPPNKIHGESNNRLFAIWTGIKSRCNNKNRKSYKYYGGRGIKIYNEWNNNYLSFKEWSLSNGYSNELTIDRIDSNGNYEPSNCRWVSRIEQGRNTRNTKINIKIATEIRKLYKKGRLTQKIIAKKYGISLGIVKSVTQGRTWK